jgi:Domain of unknown function (DUF5658)
MTDEPQTPDPESQPKAPPPPPPGASADKPVNPYHVLYPQVYLWYVLVSSLDIMFTWVLLHMGGEEVNVLADYILRRWDLTGLVVFKFMLVSLVICVCEYVGRRRPKLGRILAEWAVGITCIPVLLAVLQVLVHGGGAAVGPG